MIKEIQSIDISVVIPAFNSEQFLSETISEIISATNKSKYCYEIIIVVDGSRDKTWEMALETSEKHHHVRCIKLLRNYGQHTANLCGFRHARGSYIVTMDDDGQNPPHELEKFEKLIGSQHDLVIGKYLSKKHSLLRRFGSKFITFLSIKIFSINSELVLSNFRMIRRDVVDRIIADRSSHPYIPGLCLKYSNYQINVDVSHRERIHGKSNYKVKKLLSLTFQLLIEHSYIPLKVLAYTGVLMAGIGFTGALFIVYTWLIGDVSSAAGWRSIITILLISSGMVMAGISVLGLYIIRVIENQVPLQIIESERSWAE